jgi:ATP-dependent DNA ligase
MTGRRVSVKTGRLSEKGLCVPQLWPVKDSFRQGLIGYTVLDGEVMPPLGFGIRDLAGIMNVEPEKAEQKIKEIGLPRFYVFDSLFVDGEDIRDLNLIERRMYRDTIVRSAFPQRDVSTGKRLVIPVQGLISLKANEERVVKSQDKIEYYEKIVSRGGEGLILKDITQPYGKGWVKWKKYHTLDTVITGFTDANHGVTGKYDGLVGAVCVSVNLGSNKWVEVGQVSGMTDEMRQKISKNPKKYLGRVLEVKAQEFAKDRLRHPRWSRLRPDLSPASCTWGKMKSDLKAGRVEEE